MDKYTMMNLSFISRLAVLEHADRTRESIDDLVTILRYLERPGSEIKTVLAEMKIVKKMCHMHQMKKGAAFKCIVNNELKEDRCYIPTGIIANALRIAMDKEIAEGRESIEVILSVKESHGEVCIIIKDNGNIRAPVSGSSTTEAYAGYKQTYENHMKCLKVELKSGIGTKVSMRV